MEHGLEKLKKEKEEMEKKLANPEIFKDPQKLKEISMQFAKVEKEIKKNENTAELQKKVKEYEEMAMNGDEELKILAEEEIKKIEQELEIKEIVFEIDGEGAYQKLKHESGVHRVQRVPETEKSGRIHTSTASVAVLPKAREVDVEVKPQDIKVEFFRSSGP